MPVAIGIDFGSCETRVGVFNDGKVEIIPNDLGNLATPSYVAFDGNDTLVGEPAKNQMAMNPKNTIFDLVRLIGKKFNDLDNSDLESWPFKVTDNDGKPIIEIELEDNVKLLTPEEVSAILITKIKEQADAYLNESVTEAVLTVPANYDDEQRQAMKDVATIAGLNVLRIINGPSTAAIAYGLNDDLNEIKALILDIGGSNCNVSILAIEDGIIEIVSTTSDAQLGGKAFDNILVEYFAKEIEKEHEIDIASNARVMHRLKRACASAKCSLSTDTSADVVIESLVGDIDFCSSITRAKFDELCTDLFRGTISHIEKALADAEMSKSDIKEVVLCGGSTRIPKFQALLEEVLDGISVRNSINPEEVITHGASSQAAVLSGYKREPHLRHMLLLDVTPLSLGIETPGGMMTSLIQRNCTIPTKKIKTLKMNTDKKGDMSIKVYEGERAMANDNHLLGTFELSGVSKTPSDGTNIEFTFDLDANGILNVTARDTETGITNTIAITNDEGRLSAAEIEQMVADAEEFKEKDDKRRQHSWNKLIKHYINVIR